MKTKKIVWVDDDLELANSFQSVFFESELEIIPVDICSLEDLLKKLKNLQDKERLDLLVIDLGLSPDLKVFFDAEELAQACRKLTSNRGHMGHDYKFKHSFPIVLTSAQGLIYNVFDNENAAEDLFDYVIHKDDFVEFSHGFVSLCDGYHLINTKRNDLKNGSNEEIKSLMLGLSDRDADFVSETMQVALCQLVKSDAVTHKIAHFLLTSCIEPKGALINEATLAARLGVNRQASGSAWQQLLEKLNKRVRYEGVFSGVYERWWNGLLKQWWFEVVSQEIDLESIDAKERVRLIQERTGIETLVASEPSPEDRIFSPYFWVACYATEVPLAEEDAFQLSKWTPYPWLDPEYICYKEATSRENKKEKWKRYEIVPDDVMRLKNK